MQELREYIRPFNPPVTWWLIPPTVENIAALDKPSRKDMPYVALEYNIHMLNIEDFLWRFPLMLRLLYALHSRLHPKRGGCEACLLAIKWHAPLPERHGTAAIRSASRREDSLAISALWAYDSYQYENGEFRHTAVYCAKSKTAWRGVGCEVCGESEDKGG